MNHNPTEDARELAVRPDEHRKWVAFFRGCRWNDYGLLRFLTGPAPDFPGGGAAPHA